MFHTQMVKNRITTNVPSAGCISAQGEIEPSMGTRPKLMETTGICCNWLRYWRREYPLVHVYITNWKDNPHAIPGKTHYFYGDFP